MKECVSIKGHQQAPRPVQLLSAILSRPAPVLLEPHPQLVTWLLVLKRKICPEH